MESLPLELVAFIILLAAWTLPWKAVALWKAAQRGHVWWFIALLFLNTVAILEIIYIFLVADKYVVEVKEK